MEENKKENENIIVNDSIKLEDIKALFDTKMEEINNQIQTIKNNNIEYVNTQNIKGVEENKDIENNNFKYEFFKGV